MDSETTTYIEITYPDGTAARWAIESEDDKRIVDAETALGNPDTIAA